jgi:hypothetical protein
MTTVDKYPSEIDPAQKLFWEKMLESAKNTTKTKILVELQSIKQATEDTKNSFTDFWSGIGQMWGERKNRKK